MQALATQFPEMPAGATKSVIKPSATFKREVYNCIAAITLFVFTYIFLLIASIAIAVAFCLLGNALLMAGIWGLIAGIGFAISGVMLVFFVIKFLFKRTRTDYTGKVEIFEADQPELFSFIYKLTEETNADRPKRIFITADVNAGVFYTSSFWSMFLPVKKNLQIGLGLVNSINISEFKAVMAHEFGHFSQRSMKFGSYVYNLNKVIYNLLYDNDGYEKVLNRWARIHSIFKLMAMLNIYIIKGIQGLLRLVYIFLNKTHSKLSREMEFHADAVGAYVCGSNHMITSLKRIEIGQLCYNSLLHYWNLKLKEEIRSDNLYPEHHEVIKFYAKKHDLLADRSELPVISNETAIAGFSNIILEDQWASHPSNEDRERHLISINLYTTTVEESAWQLFRDKELLQKKLTDQVYSPFETTNNTSAISLQEFKADFYSTFYQHQFDKVYKDYYDDRNISQFDTDQSVTSIEETAATTFEELFSDENCALPETVLRMERDIATLDQFIDINKEIKTFDYKGIKYNRSAAPGIRNEIEQEVATIAGKIMKLDESIFIYFYKACKTEELKMGLMDRYKKNFAYDLASVKDYDRYNDIMIAMSPVYTTMKPDKILHTVNAVYRKEKTVKPRLTEIIADDELTTHLTPEELKAINVYLKNKWIYYYEPTYDNNAISVFNNAMNAYVKAVSSRNLQVKKDLLNYQLSIIKE